MKDEFKRIRTEMGLSQVQLAALMGVQQATISRWETGENPIAARNMIALRALAAQRMAA